MKKIFNTLLILSILFAFILLFNPNSVQAVALDDIEISTNKDTVNPGDTITLTITFGKPLGAYTFDIAYDNNLLEYMETDGGTPNDNGTRVRVVFYDSTGGSSPKESMHITFKAKEGIMTSNPTDLAVTAEGLSNPDASESELKNICSKKGGVSIISLILAAVVVVFINIVINAVLGSL